MKKLWTILALAWIFSLSAQGMSYEQARRQALFLTDKMAYELNLTDEQYEAAYEINLDYLLGIDTYNDLYGNYWRQRNLDLSYILLSWQYDRYMEAAYFYRPLYWDGGYWHFRIYARYPRRDYYYFGCPTFYTVYTGGHSWRMNGGRSYYEGRRYAPRHERNYVGMRNRYDRGDFGQGTIERNGTFGNGRQQAAPQQNGSRVRSDGSRAYGGNSRSTGFRLETPVTPGQQNKSLQRNGTNYNTPAHRRTPTYDTDPSAPVRSSTRTTVRRGSGAPLNIQTPSRSFTPQPNNGGARRQSVPRQNFSAPTAPSIRSRSGNTPSMNRNTSPRRGSISFGGRR